MAEASINASAVAAASGKMRSALQQSEDSTCPPALPDSPNPRPFGRQAPAIVGLVRKLSRKSSLSAASKQGSGKDEAGGSAGGGSLPRASSFARTSTTSTGSENRLQGSGSYQKGVLGRKATLRVQQLSTSYRSRRQLMESDNVYLPPWVIHPHDIRAQMWWAFILSTVLLTLWFDPYCLAFAAYPGLFPLDSPDTVLQILLMVVFLVDICLNFFVAFYDDTGALVVDMRAIAKRYTRRRLWIDLISTIPFDWICLAALGLQHSNSTLAWYVSMLRLLRLLRAYRLGGWLTYLTYNQSVSLLWLTLTRNLLLAFYVVHWAACIFYFIAKQSGFTNSTWVGAMQEWVGDASTTPELYIFALYWSTVTFGTVGYGDIHAMNWVEALFTVFYIFVAIGTTAYIVGSMTLLLLKDDESKSRYREAMGALEAYTTTHDVPRDLKEDMKAHLRLHFSTQESGDESVLSAYPTMLRRRVLRHLYSEAIAFCWLFHGCRQKFLDGLMAAARVELYMPKVELVAEGDHVNELCLIVAGTAVVEGTTLSTITESVTLEVAEESGAHGLRRPSGGLASKQHQQPHKVPELSNRSVHGAATRMLGAGDVYGEMAFATETPATESVRTLTACRVLVLPRSAYAALAAQYPISGKAMLENLLEHAENLVEEEFPGGTRQAMAALAMVSKAPGTQEASAAAAAAAAIALSGAAAGGVAGGQGNKDPFTAYAFGQQGGGGLAMSSTGRARLALANLLRVRMLVEHAVARLQEERTNAFLNAAATGNIDKIKEMLRTGLNVNSADYDGRTALMLAASKGLVPVVQHLLAAGAAAGMRDNLGGSALLEACKAGHEDVIDLLLAAGAKLDMPPATLAAHMCTCVFDGDLMLLRRMLRAGANPDVGDYDNRTALHIAASDGSIAAVKVLVEEGGARHAVLDRWGHTPLDEALRCGAAAVVSYLEDMVGGKESELARRRWRERMADEVLTAAAAADCAALHELLRRGFSPNAAHAYDGRTALMVACKSGQQDVVDLLLTAGANPGARDASGSSALLEAAKAGHDAIVDALRARGAALGLAVPELASLLCNVVSSGDGALLARLLRAGANASAADYDLRQPIHVAAALGKTDMVRLLVEVGGADPTAQDTWGYTAIDEAQRKGHKEVAEYLKGVLAQRRK